MINNKRSYTEYTITSPTTDFAIGFENYGVGAKDIIEVTLNGVLVESLGHTVRLKNAQVLEVTPAIKAGTVRLQRVTAIDSSFHKFTAGALFTAKSMDENFEQIRHSQQEVKDGFLQAVLKQAAQFSEYKQIITAQVNTSLAAVNQAVQAFSGRVGALEGSVTGIIRDLYQFGDKAAQYTKGAVRAAITDAQVNIGFVTIDSFELGATITQRNQALRHAADGKLYRWAGDLPKVVPVGSTPTNSGGISSNAWLEVSDVTLRQDIMTGGLVTDAHVNTTAKLPTAIGRYQSSVNAESISVQDFGAVGDGITDDSLAFQRGLDALSAIYMTTGMPQTLLVPRGIYVIKLVALRAGVNIIGNNDCVLKKPPANGLLGSALKWWRMLTVDNSSYADQDSEYIHRISIENIEFDGNRRNGNWGGGYEQEQAHCIFAGKATSLVTAEHKRFKINVENCSFKDSAADGIAIHSNADITFSNITAYDCFRSGISITGGNTIVNGKSFNGVGARIDIEVDGLGFGGTNSIVGHIDNMVSIPLASAPKRDGADLGEVGSGGDFLVTNSKFHGQINLHSLNGGTKFRDCNFIHPYEPKSSSDRFYGAIMRFDTCTFHIPNSPERTTTTIADYYPRNIATDVVNDELMFKDCKFTLDPALLDNPAVTKTYAFKSQAAVADFANEALPARTSLVVFDNCKVSPEFSGLADFGQGGRVEVRDCKYNGTGNLLRLTQSTARPYQVVLKGYIDNKGSTNLMTSRAQTYQENSYIHFYDCWVDVVKVSDATLLSNVTGRVNYFTPSTPSSVFTTKCAKAHSNNSVTTPTVAAYSTTNNGIISWIPISSTASTTKWGVSEQLFMSGVTGGRPTLSSNDTGYKYYDTTLVAEVIWNGTAWVDSTGIAV